MYLHLLSIYVNRQLININAYCYDYSIDNIEVSALTILVFLSYVRHCRQSLFAEKFITIINFSVYVAPHHGSKAKATPRNRQWSD